MLLLRGFLSLIKSPFFPKHQVDRGVPLLCAVLKEANEQRQSKSWYLLRALTLQTCSSYLSLDTALLPQIQRRSITQHGEFQPLFFFFLAVLFELFDNVELMDCLSGLNSADTALYEGLKLLCSLLVTVVGRGLFGTNAGSSEMRFIGQGKLTPYIYDIYVCVLCRPGCSYSFTAVAMLIVLFALLSTSRR